jgi:serine protease Do
VTLQNLNADLAPQFGLKATDRGAIVADVTPGAPGSKAGLKSGDVITAIDGKKVEGSDDLTMDVISHAPGSTVTLDVIRNGSPTKVTVTLGQRPGGVDWDQRNKSGESDQGEDNGNTGNASARGITVETLTSELAQQVGVSPNTHGVVVDDVDESSPAAEAGIARGFVITAVDRKPVNNAQEFKRFMSQAQGKPVLLTINQGGASGFVVVQPK